MESSGQLIFSLQNITYFHVSNVLPEESLSDGEASN